MSAAALGFLALCAYVVWDRADRDRLARPAPRPQAQGQARDGPRAMNILTVGHSYVVALNRRLCRELARAGGVQVRVTVAAPASFHGDLRPIALEPCVGEPYRLEPVPVRGSKIPHMFWYSRRLARLLHGGRWDVVHAWQEPFVLAGGQISWHTPRALRSCSRPSRTCRSGTHRRSPRSSATAARASGWTAFGRTVAEALQDRPGYRDRPMRVIPLGVDCDVFRPDPEARRKTLATLGWSDPGPPVIGFLGRFVPEKGVELLRCVLDRLEPDSWRALWVGGGAKEGDLRAWAGRHGGLRRVVTGVAHDAVPAYLNAMDLLAAPSQATPRWKEQLGRMLLEAMASGVPVVASDSGEIPHVVADAGQVVAESDESAWTEALRALLASSDRRRELRGAAWREPTRSTPGPSSPGSSSTSSDKCATVESIYNEIKYYIYYNIIAKLLPSNPRSNSPSLLIFSAFSTVRSMNW